MAKQQSKARSRKRPPTGVTNTLHDNKIPANEWAWRAFCHFTYKGTSLTLGLPFAMVVVALALRQVDWNKIGVEADVAKILLGSISALTVGVIRRTRQ